MTIVNLDIDSINYYWRHDVPAYLLFLFDRDNSYCIEDKTEADDEWDSESKLFEIGFQSTAEKILINLDYYGYTIHFFSEIYGSLYSDLKDNYIEVAKHALTERHVDDPPSEDDINRQLLEHLNKFPDIGRRNELEDFIRLTKAFLVLESSNQSPSSQGDKLLTLGDRKTYEVDYAAYSYMKEFPHAARGLDFDALTEYTSCEILSLPPWISEVANLFDSEYYRICPEIMSLLHLRFILEAVDPDKEVKLTTHVDSDDNGKMNLDVFLSQLSNTLVRKVALYNKAFEPLFSKEEALRARYVKSEGMKLLNSCNADSKYKKGLILERLIELLFTDGKKIEAVNKRVNTGDEEIDLVIKNTMTSPFWQAFNSPLFFVECKNWSKSVGSKEIRDFEMKIQNHSKLAKIGFFVSLNGFTSGVDSELKRCSREDYHIVTLSKDEIEEFFKTDKLFYKWLEDLMTKKIY